MGWEPTNNPSIRHRVENQDLLNLIVFHGLPDSNKEDKLQKIENKSLCKKSLPCQTDLSDQLTHAVWLTEFEAVWFPARRRLITSAWILCFRNSDRKTARRLGGLLRAKGWKVPFAKIRILFEGNKMLGTSEANSESEGNQCCDGKIGQVYVMEAWLFRTFDKHRWIRVKSGKAKPARENLFSEKAFVAQAPG